ncbi:MAG: hypothetical protein ACTSU3_06395 [Candidatus Thorarchaeota archaeon]
MKKASSSNYEPPHDAKSDSVLSSFQTPYDDLFPEVKEASAVFYLDVMRIYLGLVCGSLSMEDAQYAVKQLKENPEFMRSPMDPTLLPLRDSFKQNILDNLKTLSKFNLLTTDSIRSACSFAFLTDVVQLNNQDLEVLSFFASQPVASVSAAAKRLGLATRTVSRSMKRLKDHHRVRFISLMDHSVFGLQTVIVFFTPRLDIDWDSIENALYSYPLTKVMLKTTMVDLGYLSIIIPKSADSLQRLEQSISTLSKTVFNYTSLHFQTGIGTTRNLSLYKNGEWNYPKAFEHILKNNDVEVPITLWNSETELEFSEIDFLIGSEYKLDCRASPRKICEALSFQGYDVEPKRVTYSLKKLNKHGLTAPYIAFSGLGLSANFCFEIICNDYWKKKVISLLPHIPVATYNVTSKGIIVWIQVPSAHQVDYYKVFRSIEENDGVTSVLPIMTIMQKGSRSVGDLVKYWTFGRNGWMLNPEIGDLADYVSSRY